MSAYDSNAVYEPPRRAYMATQRQPQAGPAYSNSSYEDHHRDPYEQPQQQQYQPPYQSSGYDYGYDQQPHPQEHGYDDGYGGAYGRPQHDYQQQREERAYDPRYQQRAPRGPPPHQQSRPPPSQRGPPPSTRDARPRDPRQQYDQAQSQSQSQSQRPRGPYEQQNGYSQPRQEPAKAAAMDEWKAREKVRMKQEAVSPEGLPFDNAFPVFGNKKKDSRGAASTPDQRASGEQAQSRPRTANGSQQRGSRGNSYQSRDDVPVPSRRPDMDRQYSAPDFVGTRQNGVSFDQRETHNSYPLQRSQAPVEQLATPVGEGYPDQWPMVSGHSPPKPQPQRSSPPHVNGHDQRNTSNARGGTSQSGLTPYTHASKQQKLAKPRGPPPAIDTSQDHQYQRPVYMNHQPLTPANVPPRPSTSQGARSPAKHQVSNLPMQQPQSATLHDGYNYQPKPWVQEQQHTRSGSLDDIYSGYAAPDPEPKPLARAPTTRDEEIEMEMPDFDSAAPGQTSRLQRRMQSPDDNGFTPSLQRTQTAPPPQMPQSRSVLDSGYTQPPPPPPQSYPAQDGRFNQQGPQQFGPRPAHTPGPRGPPRRGMTADGYGDDARPMPAQERQYDVAYRNMPPQEPQYQNSPYEQSAPLPAPQAPYANEPQVRRSFDDARQAPPRRGPPQPQRFYQNGLPPRGDYSQQQPGMNSAGQQGRANPMNGNAPPEQNMRRPPAGVANGPPVNQQNNVPERNSNPDALPHHPVPVRPGHALQGQPQNGKPPPVRNHNNDMSSRNGPPPQGRPSLDDQPQPITLAELERLRAAVESSKSPKQELHLVKRLVEAASVLANENGRVDAKTAGKNRERFINEAYKRLKKIVALGYPDAQFYMADCHGQGTMGLEVDTKEAFKLYQAAAKSGHAQAAYRTAVCCEMGPEAGGGTSRDYPKAVQWYKRAASLGDAAAMYKIGAVLLKGLLGQQRNIVEAVNWLKRGAEKADKENPHALHELAMLYESTNTSAEIRNKVVADDGYARELYQQAAQLGYKFSQFRLGQAYEYGNMGLTIDNRSSIAWYTKAAAQGEHQAELALSGWYLTGAEGILEHSDTEAYLWARKAASSEPPLAKAMFAMGYFTENGIGCPASLDEARKWYGRAASHRLPKAIERLEELKRSSGKSGSKNATKPPPMSGKLTRKDQKKDEENCVVM